MRIFFIKSPVQATLGLNEIHKSLVSTGYVMNAALSIFVYATVKFFIQTGVKASTIL